MMWLWGFLFSGVRFVQAADSVLAGLYNVNQYLSIEVHLNSWFCIDTQTSKTVIYLLIFIIIVIVTI